MISSLSPVAGGTTPAKPAKGASCAFSSSPGDFSRGNFPAPSSLLEQVVVTALNAGLDWVNFQHEFRRAWCHRLLIITNGNISRAARLAGVHRNHFIRMVQASGVDRRECRIHHAVLASTSRSR